MIRNGVLRTEQKWVGFQDVMLSSRPHPVLLQLSIALKLIEIIEIRNSLCRKVEDFICHLVILNYRFQFLINIKLWVQDYLQLIVKATCTMEPQWGSGRKVTSRMLRRRSRFREPSTRRTRLTHWLTRAWSRTPGPCTGSTTSTTSGIRPATRAWSSHSTAARARALELTSLRALWPPPPPRQPLNSPCQSRTEACYSYLKNC